MHNIRALSAQHPRGGSDTMLKTESLCIVLYEQCSTRESLYIGRGESNAQVIRVLYKTV
jgi:hypothetical protein